MEHHGIAEDIGVEYGERASEMNWYWSRREVTRNVGGKQVGGMRVGIHCDGFLDWAALLALPFNSTTCLQGCTIMLLSTVVVLPDAIQ